MKHFLIPRQSFLQTRRGMRVLAVVDVLWALRQLPDSLQGFHRRLPSGVDRGELGNVGKEKCLEFIRLNVREEPILATSGLLHDDLMECALDSNGSLYGIRQTDSIRPSGKVGLQAMQIEQCGHVNIATFAQRVCADTARFCRGSVRRLSRWETLQSTWLHDNASVSEGRCQHIPHERLLRLTFADDNHFDHRAGLPPRMFIFHKSPSA